MSALRSNFAPCRCCDDDHTEPRWLWRSPAGCSPANFTRPVTWPERTSGEMAVTSPLCSRPSRRDLRLHAGLDVARVDVGDLKLDLEGRQIDDRQERRILRDARLLRRGEVRDDAVDRRADRELVDAAFQVRDDVTLALALEPLGLQVEVEALLLEACGLARARRRALRIRAHPGRDGDPARRLRPCPRPIARAGARAPRRGSARPRGPPPLWCAVSGAGSRCSAGGAPCRGSRASRARAGIRFRVGLASREHLAHLDAVARAHVIADVAGCDGEEGGAHGATTVPCAETSRTRALRSPSRCAAARARAHARSRSSHGSGKRTTG